MEAKSLLDSSHSIGDAIHTNRKEKQTLIFPNCEPRELQ